MVVRTEGTQSCVSDWLPNSSIDALKVIVNCSIYGNGLCSVLMSSKLPYDTLICHQMGNESLGANFQELIKQMQCVE